MKSKKFDENISQRDGARDLTVLDAGGVDEVSVIPWSLLLRQKIVESVGV